MEIHPDFKEFLELLNTNKVEYVIIGGYALAFHGAPRYTGDIDILINSTKKNSKKILKTLHVFGFGTLGIKEEDFQKKDVIIQLGFPPARIDILTSITGVSWEEVIRGSVKGAFGSIPLLFIGKKEFVMNKKAVGRKKDLADIEALGEE